MPSARYWRLHQPTPFNLEGSLQFTELGLYNSGTRVDGSATMSSSTAPSGGALSALIDGSTSTAVTFAKAAWSAQGFWIAWDLGSSVNVDDVRINGAASTDSSVCDFVLQSSADGIEWDSELRAQMLPHAGDGTPLTVPIVNADTYAAQTVLHLKGSGAEGNIAFTDQSASANSLTVIGDIKHTYADKLVRGPSIYLDGSNDGLMLGTDSDFNFGTGDYTIELWHKTLAFTNGFAAFMASGAATWGVNGRIFRMHNGTTTGVDKSVAYLANELSPNAYQSYTGSIVELGKWTHYALSKQGSVRRIFVDGILSSTHLSSAHSDNFNDGGFTYLFYSDFDKQSLHGYVDEFCVTKGVARYTTSDPYIPLRAAYRNRDYAGTRSRPVNKPASRDITLFSNPTVNTQVVLATPVLPKIDTVFGGDGVINGSVKEKNLPVNTPLARRVRLVEQRSGYLVAEAMSDAATGAYSFANIDRSRKYTVLSYDYTGIYRAVIADNLTPDLMT